MSKKQDLTPQQRFEGYLDELIKDKESTKILTVLE